MNRGRGDGGEGTVEFNPQELTGLLPRAGLAARPRRDGLAARRRHAALVALIWILALTQTIVTPVLTASVVAAVTSPLVGWLNATGCRAGWGPYCCCSPSSAVAVVFVVVVAASRASRPLRGHLSDAKHTIEGWLTDLGVDRQAAETATATRLGRERRRLGPAPRRRRRAQALSSLVFFLSLTALSLFFLLKDGPMIRRWGEGHSASPKAAHSIGRGSLQSLRGYFLGVTIVAAFNAVVVGVGCDRPGRPAGGHDHRGHLPRRIRPLPRRLDGGRVLRAHRARRRGHGCGGRDDRDPAAGQRGAPAAGAAHRQRRGARDPPARGARRHDRAAACLFGAAGLILAAPLTSAATRIAADLRRARTGAPDPGAQASPGIPAT